MRNVKLPGLALLPVLLLAGCSDDDARSESASTSPLGPSVSGQLVGPGGETRGTVTLSFDEGGTAVEVQANGLTPGIHGFHVHKIGRCEPASPDPADPAKTGDFLSAGGHLAAEGQGHGDHDGDLPTLLVRQDGSASLIVTTDRLPMEAVLDDDGSAVMVHELPDNFANVPERYAPQGPDQTTTKTGDSGGRVACAPLIAPDSP